MKKNILVYILIMILLITGIYIGTTKKDTKTKEIPTKKVETLIDKKKKIEYYNGKYKDRYKDYQKENQNLELEDIVTRVNLSLDKKPYEETKKNTLSQYRLYSSKQTHLYGRRLYSRRFRRIRYILCKKWYETCEKGQKSCRANG